MPDYRSNAHKNKPENGDLPEKKIMKVVSGDVVVQKRSVGRRFKDVFAKADLRNAGWYVISDILIPAAKHMFVDGVTGGVERLAYGDRAIRQRNYGGAGPRFTYNRPVQRYGSAYSSNRAPLALPEPRTRSSQYGRDDLVLSSREEAELVLERMKDIIDTYEVASVGDLNELVGIPSTPIDNKWGWIFLDDVAIRQIREGWLLDFPPPEPIS